MMRITRFSLIFLALWSYGAQAGYTLADLEVLSQEGSFEEFFHHALDVRPSERQDAWKGMVTKMADGFGRQILAKSEITKAQFRKMEELYAWPALKADDVFKGHRQEIGLRYLKSCLKLETPCQSDLKVFWEADSKDAELAFKLAELTTSLPSSNIPVWTFLDVALKSSLSEFYCKKDFVLTALWGKFEIDYIRLGSKGDLLKKIDTTVHPDCLISFNQWTQNKLNRPDKTSDRELAYQLLAAQGKVNQSLTDFFYTVYLLENPSQGELFNYAWNRLNDLGKSSARREEVMNRLKKLDPLPDELLGSMDQTKKKTILYLFKNKFPEYLQYYSEQCLAFYGGQAAFPNGNPTIHCQDLMNLETATELVGEDKIKRFQNVRSI